MNLIKRLFSKKKDTITMYSHDVLTIALKGLPTYYATKLRKTTDDAWPVPVIQLPDEHKPNPPHINEIPLDSFDAVIAALYNAPKEQATAQQKAYFAAIMFSIANRELWNDMQRDYPKKNLNLSTMMVSGGDIEKFDMVVRKEAETAFPNHSVIIQNYFSYFTPSGAHYGKPLPLRLIALFKEEGGKARRVVEIKNGSALISINRKSKDPTS